MLHVRRPFFKRIFALSSAVIVGALAVVSPPGAQANAVSGAWSETLQWPLVAVHMIVLPTGKVLVWSRPDDKGALPPPPHVWNPANGAMTPLSFPAGVDPYCSGHALLPNGHVLITGLGDSGDAVETFNPFASTWSPLVGDSGTARYYPTHVPLGNGDQLVLGGTIQQAYPPPQIWKKGGGWQDLTTAEKVLPLYPRSFQTSVGGKVFVAGPGLKTWWLNTSGTGAWSLGPAHALAATRRSGMGVMFDQDKIIVIGGTPGFEEQSLPTATAEIINLKAAPPQWTFTQPMQSPRLDANATILPNGQVLVTGGTSKKKGDKTGFVYAAELWNPETGTWVTLASMTTPRVYHSSAVLLPDGRVLAAGGGRHRTGDDYPSAQIFSPPYLFSGSRPVINSAPTSVAYGQVFTVQTPNAANISKVSLVRLSSTTHSYNMNQRLNWLPITSRTATSLRVQAPPTGTICPPGHYLLTILQGAVPSVSKIVRIGS